MLLTTALLSFSGWIGSKIADKGFDVVYNKITNNSEFDTKFNECIEKASIKLEGKYPDVLGNSISYFFKEEQVFNEVCKLLFFNQNVNLEIIAETFDETTLPYGFISEFISEFKSEISEEPIFQELLANKEIYLTVKGISKDIGELTTTSTLTLREVYEIKKVLEERFKSSFDVESFLSLYLRNTTDIHNTVNFIGLGIDPSIKKGKRKNIDSIFVEPKFILNSKHHLKKEKECKIEYNINKNEKGESEINYSQIFERPYNYVILGNPGSGKSLLVKSIMLDLINKKNRFNNADIENYIPFRVELRKYQNYKKSKRHNLLKYISSLLEEEYSVSIVSENLSTLFKTRNCIIFFDGLDEIFDINDKLNIKNDIELFHNSFPSVKSITTSRYIGYNDAKLNEDNFFELILKSFDKDQIKEYVTRWYLLEEENETIREQEINDFILKMNNISFELLSNPLLLSLIVILYRNNLKIPESKLEIYQSCTNTLVDKWDANKGLVIQLPEPIQQKKEPLFSDLAFWQYELLSSKETKESITYSKAKIKISESLVKKRLADDDNSLQLADAFLDYAQKRSIYFDNNFTHKTFLEYYTAYWVYSNIEKKHNIAQRNNLISKYIPNSFWYIVLELLLNMIDKDQPDYEVIDDIFINNLSEVEALPFLLYVLPNVKNISEEITSIVYEKTISALLEKGKQKIEKAYPESESLFNQLSLNLEIKDQTEVFIKVCNQYEDKGIMLYILLNELNKPIFRSNLSQDLFKDVFSSDDYQIQVNKDPYLYQINSWDDKISFESIVRYIDNFGVEEIFKEHISKFDSFGFAPYIHRYFMFQILPENIFSIVTNLAVLNSKSVETFMLIKYLTSIRMPFLIEEESFQFLCDEISSTSDEQIKLLYLILLTYGYKNRILHKEQSLDISNMGIDKDLLNILSKVLHIKKRHELIPLLVSELNITNPEILELAL